AGGCSSDSKLAVNSDLARAPYSIHVTSPAIGGDGMIPVKYTQDGKNVSLPVAWSGAPSGTKELVVLIEDPDAIGEFPYIHWFVYKIPATTTQIVEGAAGTSRPQGPPVNSNLTQGKNYLGRIGYDGPKPPPGATHRYFIEVFALDTEQDWEWGMERSKVRG